MSASLPPGAGHYQFDLEAYVADRLAKYAIGPIAPLGLDTYGARPIHSFRAPPMHARPIMGAKSR
jgi:copper oxidase (laccase) domain-containing protein